MKHDRDQAIIELLKQKSFRSVEELCSGLGVSPATIRRDLHSLEEQGAIIRVNGGAVLNGQATETTELVEDPYVEEKKRIAMAAARMVKEGDTIFMDAGSTNAHIADQLLAYSNITIITNSLQIAHKFLGHQGVSVIVCGGALGEVNPASIVGPVAETMIATFRANICFLGSLGIHMKQGVTDPFSSTARIKQKMIENSNQVVFALDRSKFGMTKTFYVCSAQDIDCLITDQLAPRDDIQYYVDQGIRVILV